MVKRDFQYPKGKSKPGINLDNLTAPAIGDFQEEGEMGLIQGREPQSIIEWRAAKSFWKYKIDFIYQLEFFGGRRVPGGFVLDFLIYIPFPLPVPIQGDYWHGKYDRQIVDDIQMGKLKDIFRVDPVPLYEHELQSQAESDRVIGERFAL
jgi:hypothetical protein